MRNYPTKKQLLLFCGLFIFNTNAKCLRDIWSVGASLDSVVYKGKRTDTDLAELGTENAYGIKGAWVNYCPTSKVEYSVYTRLRILNFGANTKKQAFAGVRDSVTLPSFGLEAKKGMKFGNQVFDLIADIEVRNELGLISDLVNNFLYDAKYWNLKAMAGIRYYVWQDNKRDLTTTFKAGPLAPISSNDEHTNLGWLYGGSLEYFQKMGRKASLRLDLYYDFYKQDYANLEMLRQELGMRANIVFRL